MDQELRPRLFNERHSPLEISQVNFDHIRTFSPRYILSKLDVKRRTLKYLENAVPVTFPQESEDLNFLIKARPSKPEAPVMTTEHFSMTEENPLLVFVMFAINNRLYYRWRCIQATVSFYYSADIYCRDN